MSRCGLAARVLVMALAFALLGPVQALAIRRGWALAGRIPIAYHRLFLRLFAIRVQVIGDPPRPGSPTLVVSNHVSWVDIPAIASLAPLSFVAKQEIAGWPVFGLFARLQRCIFVDRTRRAATAEVNALLGRRLAAGDVMVLFAEGTTGDGIRLLPFRSSLLGAARAALAESSLQEVSVQPLSIAYVGRNGLPVTRREMPSIAWYGDADLLPHLAAFVRGGPTDVLAVWGEPIGIDPSSDRKRATAAAEAAVRAGLVSARDRRLAILLAGRTS